jgi:uncharacterized protein YacL
VPARLLLKCLLAAVLTGAGLLSGNSWLGAAAGLTIALVTVFLEARLRLLPAPRLLSLAAGLLFALAAAALLSVILPSLSLPPFFALAALASFAYIGLSLGWAHNAAGEAQPTAPPQAKILDTSVLIDGRIADIAATGFLDGAIIIPAFVLRELQYVADSHDSSRRTRGRHGLDILKKLQAMPALTVQLTGHDYPKIPDVDLKLLELAKQTNAKVVTNDFNLNKVAQVHGVPVLNINDLANSVKPVVLPGESLRVFVLKEGKEPNQGIAYLDDGTMVVIDHARKQISKTIDVTVTSVLQTTAGKMIFGKYE